MKIEIEREVMKAMRDAGYDNPAFHTSYSFGSETVDSRHMNAEELQKLKEICTLPEYHKDIENRRVIRAINNIQDLDKAGGNAKISNLQKMEEALIKFLQPLPHHWVFIENKTHDVMLPYFIKNIKYHPPYNRGEDYIPARLELKGEAFKQGSKETPTISLHKSDLAGGKTVGDLLSDIGWIPETAEMVDQYEADIAFFNEASVKEGYQFLGKGLCSLGSDRWDRTIMNLEKKGSPSKVIMDNDEGEENKKTSCVIGSTMWVVLDRKKTKDEMEEEEDSSETVHLPVHPFVTVFVLDVHQYGVMYIRNLTDYKYDAGLADKLVLSDDRRELIDLLIGSEQDGYSDIVEGKGKGVIILTSGVPGTGKTLTAEVFSEKVERPLYIIQCSQLGTDPDELEKLLAEVLERATRWGAILLIDEADVYIHERGADVVQNAIVGVFLRLLEYYSGVLFLTTNRETLVDDAIKSRVMAHVRYKLPDYDEKVKLWKILSEQYGANISPAVIKELVEDKSLKMISGRSIKQLCRLSKALANKRVVPIDKDLVKWVARFQDIETGK